MTFKDLPELTPAIINRYKITLDDNFMHINHPAYVNIQGDDKFSIETTTETIKIRNRKASVLIFKHFTQLHVTVL